MQIEIPPDSESFVRTRAKAAGFDNIQDYVLSLILEDDVEQLDIARLERLAVEGLESGDAGTMTQEDWQAMRGKTDGNLLPIAVEP